VAVPNSLSLDGQGNPLPEHFPYKGEWLLDPQLFLYRPDANQTAGDRELTPVVSAGGQNWSSGINAVQLAFALRVGVDKLFECNRNGTLVFVCSDEVAPNRGTLPALRLIFKIDDRQTAIILEGLPMGTA
jgi:hypothetical protein